MKEDSFGDFHRSQIFSTSRFESQSPPPPRPVYRLASTTDVILFARENKFFQTPGRMYRSVIGQFEAGLTSNGEEVCERLRYKTHDPDSLVDIKLTPKIDHWEIGGPAQFRRQRQELWT